MLLSNPVKCNNKEWKQAEFFCSVANHDRYRVSPGREGGGIMKAGGLITDK